MNRHQRLFFRKYGHTIVKWIAIALLVISFIVLFIIRQPDLAAHNKYQCAVYGMQEDCKTPLAPEDRLK